MWKSPWSSKRMQLALDTPWPSSADLGRPHPLPSLPHPHPTGRWLHAAAQEESWEKSSIGEKPILSRPLTPLLTIYNPRTGHKLWAKYDPGREALNLPSKAGFLACDQCNCLCTWVPALEVLFCCLPLKIINNLIFALVFCKIYGTVEVHWELWGPGSRVAQPPTASGGRVLSCLLPHPHLVTAADFGPWHELGKVTMGFAQSSEDLRWPCEYPWASGSMKLNSKQKIPGRIERERPQKEGKNFFSRQETLYFNFALGLANFIPGPDSGVHIPRAQRQTQGAEVTT